MMNGPSLGDIVLSMLPLAFLIGAWAFFMWRAKRPGGYQADVLTLMQRQTEALERIANKLDRT
jgi:ATP-dependent Zn protease